MENYIFNKIVNLLIHHSNHVIGTVSTIAALVVIYLVLKARKGRR